MHPVSRCIAASALMLLPLSATWAQMPDASAAEPAPITGIEAQVPVGAEVVIDNTPFTMTEADRKIAAQVIDVLAADDKLRGRIAVSVLNGEVLLSGKVKSVPMIYRAVELSRRVVSHGKVNTDHLWRG